MLDSDPGQNGGGRITQPLRDLLAAISSAFHTRLELLFLEVHEELERSKQSAALFLTMIGSFGFGFVLLNIFVVALFWQNGWIAAIGFLALLYFAAGLYCAIKLRAALVRPSGLFSETLKELGKDRDSVKGAEP
jgi:uncharacterized membrane protein YqjE